MQSTCGARYRYRRALETTIMIHCESPVVIWSVNRRATADATAWVPVVTNDWV